MLVEYNRDLFARVTIASLMETWQVQLERGLAEPARPISEYPLLSGEQAERLWQWNSFSSAAPLERAMIDLFLESVALGPERIAIVDGDLELSYGELDLRATQVARRLLEGGLAKGDDGAARPAALGRADRRHGGLPQGRAHLRADGSRLPGRAAVGDGRRPGGAGC